MGKTMVIFGSSRRNGDTGKAFSALDPDSQMKFVNVNELNISSYDYENKNQNDDFLSLVEEMLEYDSLVIATPIYWLVMSAQIKIFMDRFKDCTSIRKDLGRALAGKKLHVLAVYNNSYLSDFESIFKGFANYMDMEYKGTFFYYSGDDVEKIKGNVAIDTFREGILNG